MRTKVAKKRENKLIILAILEIFRGEITTEYTSTASYIVDEWLGYTFSFVTVTDNTAIDETQLEATYKAAPNPFTNEVNLLFANTGE